MIHYAKGNSAVRRETAFFKSKAESVCKILVICLLSFSANTYFKNVSSTLAVLSAKMLVPNLSIISVTETENYNANKTDNTISDITIADNSSSTFAVSDSIGTTPQDIIKLSELYKKEYSNAKHDGRIIEKTYDKKSATSVFENITVRNTTPSHSINIEKSLNEKADLHITDKSKPTVLIFHTHTTESYQMINEGWYTKAYPTRHDDKNQNMVRIGNAICEELEKNGIGVIHDTEIHDRKYTGAYDNSRKTVEKILKDNPTIQIVLDVHRDAIQQSDGTKIKPTFTYNGKKAAQVMIIAGCEDGKIENFPNWEKNLTFALQLHKEIETMFPQMMRPVLFSARKYNMDVVPCSVLLEFGSDSNTLAEAEYSGRLVGMALSEYIEKYSEE